MLHITSASGKKSMSIEHSSTFEELLKEVCGVFRTPKDRIVLALVEENNDKFILENQEDYGISTQSGTDLNLTVFIRPRTYSRRKIQIFTAIFLVLSLLAQYFLDLPINIFEILMFPYQLLWEIFDMLQFLAVNITGVFYWLPFVIPLVYFSYLGNYWIFPSRTISKTKFTYWVFFTSNLIPNLIGFLTSMLGVLWIVLVCVNVVLHKPRPLTSKDTTFLLVLLVYLLTSVARIIYFY